MFVRSARVRGWVDPPGVGHTGQARSTSGILEFAKVQLFAKMTCMEITYCKTIKPYDAQNHKWASTKYIIPICLGGTPRNDLVGAPNVQMGQPAAVDDSKVVIPPNANPTPTKLDIEKHRALGMLELPKVSKHKGAPRPSI